MVDLTEMTNEVFHVTFFPDTGEVHMTSTEEDSFTGVDETSGVTYRGHALFWDNLTSTTTTRTSRSRMRSTRPARTAA